MGLFTRALKGDTSSEQVIPKYMDSAFIAGLIGSVVVGRETTMSIPVLKRSINFISDTISMLDWHLYKKDESGNIIDKCDYRVDLLNKHTNSTMKSNDLIKNLVLDYLLYGSAYCYVDKSLNHINSLTYINPIEVSVTHVDTDPFVQDYRLNIQGQEVEEFRYVTLLNGGTVDGLQGLGGIINDNSELIELAYLINSTMKAITNSSKLVVNSNRQLTEESLAALRANIQKLLDSPSGSLVLNEGISVSELGRSSVDNQFVQMYEQVQKQLSYMLGIPLSVLDGTASDEVYNQVVKSVVLPIISTIESAISDVMLSDQEGKTMEFKVDTKALLRTSLKERYDAYAVAIKAGFMSRNDVRKLENMSVVDGLDLYSYSLADVLYDPTTNTYKNFNMDSVSGFKEQEAGEIDGN